MVIKGSKLTELSQPSRRDFFEKAAQRGVAPAVALIFAASMDIRNASAKYKSPFKSKDKDKEKDKNKFK